MSDKVEDSVRLFIARERLLAPDALHLVALSGGADSVALLLILKRLGYRVEAAHCNFHLRGAESDRDETFVKNLCEAEQIPLHLIHFDTKAYADLHRVSIEMAARDLRYRYFEQLRQDIGADEVCVAHHQDDAVETLLMNLVRGTGIHGLTGIRPRNGHIVRPLLCVSRSDILSFLDAVGQPYVTDSSNLVPDVVRNKLRLNIIPALRELNPAVSENIVRTATLIGEVEKVYNHAVREALATLVVDNAIDIQVLLREPSPESLLYEWLMPKGFSSSQVEQIYGCLSGDSGRTFQSSTHELIIDRSRLIVEQCKAELPVLRIPETGTYQYAEAMKFRFQLSDSVTISRVPDTATLDAAKLSFPLTIRPVQTGDRFQPFGMQGSRLVSDYLTDRKRTLFEKRRQLVVTTPDGTILWLVGERTDQRFAVDATTRQVLTIQMSDLLVPLQA